MFGNCFVMQELVSFLILRSFNISAELSALCIVAVSVFWLFLAVLWVGLKCVTVVYPGHNN